jgi:hypothetical protein
MPDLRKTFDTTYPGFVRTAGMQMVITDAALAAEENGETKSLATDPETDEDAARIKADHAQPTLQSADEKPAIVEAKPAEPVMPASEPAQQEIAAPKPAPQPEMKQEIAAPQPVPAAPAKSELSKPELAGSEPAKPETKEDITATVLPQPADIPDAVLASFERSLAAKAKRTGPTGPVSVFISRKDKRLYVRQAFIPLFTAEVKFKDESAPFGTHVFTAYEREDGKSLRWTAVTMPAEATIAEPVKPTYRIDARGRKVELPAKPSKPVEAGAVPAAASVLDRIEIPQDVVERISYYVSPGSSLIVADHGIGHETGLYTDFIVVTKK